MPKQIERIAGLDDRLSTEICPKPEGNPAAKSFRLACHEGPDYRFNGWMVFCWQGKRNAEGRWLALELYATYGGHWVAASVWCSDNPDEADMRRARKVETVREVMEAWGWGTYAKATAKALRWDVVVRLGGEG